MINIDDTIGFMVDKYNCIAVLINRRTNTAFGPVIQGRFAEGIADEFISYIYTRYRCSPTTIPTSRLIEYYKDFEQVRRTQ